MRSLLRHRPGLAATVAGTALLLTVAPSSDVRAAQSRGAATRRHATTVPALVAYPVFFHTLTVRVRGTVGEAGGHVTLEQGGSTIALVGPAVAGLRGGPPVIVEVAGTFLDVGRLSEGDPRLAGVDVTALSNARLGKPWPSVGELLLVAADTIEPAEPFIAPTVRALALEPDRYVDARVTVVGRFRGRNLYADQPDAPGRSRWDFVLQSADASVWVVGRRPRGQGFNLDVQARVDTGRWLEVTGTVTRDRHLVIIEAAEIVAAKPPAEAAVSEPVARVPSRGPSPEVVFSAPTQDETDVSPTTRVRIQFSRDLAPDTLKGRVRVAYVEAPSPAGPPPPLPVSARYDEGTRVLELRFTEQLESFRIVKVELLDGITATDGAPLAPWTLTFSLGS